VLNIAQAFAWQWQPRLAHDVADNTALLACLCTNAAFGVTICVAAGDEAAQGSAVVAGLMMNEVYQVRVLLEAMAGTRSTLEPKGAPNMPITRRERMLTALAHQQPDVTPWQIDLTSDAREATARYLCDDEFESKIGNHFVGMEDGWSDDVGHGRWRDNFGVVWNRTIDRDIGNVETLLLPEPDVRLYRFPRPDHARNAARVQRLLSENEGVFTGAGIGFSMFERAWTLRGMENLLMDMVLHPRFVDDLLDAILAYNLEVLDSLLQFPVDCIRFGDDWGQQHGLIMGPRLWRRFIKPRVAAMYARVKSAGRFVMQHSCGDVAEIFPDLIEIGLDIFNTFQPEVMDVDLAKREYGAHLMFYGGISTQQVLPRIAPSDVRAYVYDMIARIGKDGGYLVAPTHAIPRDVPPATIAAFIDAVQSQTPN